MEMNARQRRKAYRAMPKKMQTVEWTRSNGVVLRGVVIGPKPVTAPKWHGERGNVNNVLRVRVHLGGGAHMHPFARDLRIL